MSLNNPVDLQPVLTQLQSALNDLAALSQKVTDENGQVSAALQTQTDEIDAVLQSLTAVNGELDTNATAINNHTTSEVGAAKSEVLAAVSAAAVLPETVLTSTMKMTQSQTITPPTGCRIKVLGALNDNNDACTCNVSDADTLDSLGNIYIRGRSALGAIYGKDQRVTFDASGQANDFWVLYAIEKV